MKDHNITQAIRDRLIQEGLPVDSVVVALTPTYVFDVPVKITLLRLKGEPERAIRVSLHHDLLRPRDALESIFFDKDIRQDRAESFINEVKSKHLQMCV